MLVCGWDNRSGSLGLGYNNNLSNYSNNITQQELLQVLISQ